MAKRVWFVLSLCATAALAQGLHDLAVKSGKLFFGTATDTNLFKDAAYMAAVNRTGEFGLVVPENSQKWDATEKTQGAFLFKNADAVLALAQANNQMMRCHALTWHSQLPQFVSAGTWTPETLTPVIEAHIANVVGHYKGACYSWDVVNEALADNGSLRDSVFSRTLGADFIPVSFKAAAAADPAARLYYNDFGLEFDSRKTEGAVRIVQDLTAAGVKIDGLGLQGHFEVGKTPSAQTLARAMGRFTDLGLEVALTELDVRHARLPADDAAVRQQAKDYATAVKACVDNARCVGVVVWEFTDKHSWVPSTFKGAGDACLFDKEMRPKPAYTAVAEVLGNATAAGNGSAKMASPSAAGVSATGTGTGPDAAAGVGADSGMAPSSDGAEDGAKASVEASPSSSGTGPSHPLFDSSVLFVSWVVGMLCTAIS
ncbi:Endo-1,4-beta-xylanase 5 [Colletotrichum chlorophyti]|uniref:Beta-xylanase n=1 Tax=Colletotrichum chlorophyti TaxID=708187 RepID=A0A1Q8RG56_9PEZI|nr:Endo-1,4-beta-xylanase 5 [Colletotrichum chlorophyti]